MFSLTICRHKSLRTGSGSAFKKLPKVTQLLTIVTSINRKTSDSCARNLTVKLWCFDLNLGSLTCRDYKSAVLIHGFSNHSFSVHSWIFKSFVLLFLTF